MHSPHTDSMATTRVHCDVTDRSGSDSGVRTYEWCPFCGDRIAGDAGHELVVSVSE